jgi:hypothetical protein
MAEAVLFRNKKWRFIPHIIPENCLPYQAELGFN